MADISPMMTTAHHVTQGQVVMYKVDAHSAAANFPDEWSLTPWDPQSADEARRRLHDRKVAEAREKGHPEPEPPVQVEMTDEERAEFEEWKAQRDAAAERKAERDKAEAEKRERDAQAAVDEAILQSSPPQPDPNRRRLTGAAKANAERKAERLAAEEEARAQAEAEDRRVEAARLSGNVGKPRRPVPGED